MLLHQFHPLVKTTGSFFFFSSEISCLLGFSFDSKHEVRSSNGMAEAGSLAKQGVDQSSLFLFFISNHFLFPLVECFYTK